MGLPTDGEAGVREDLKDARQRAACAERECATLHTKLDECETDHDKRVEEGSAAQSKLDDAVEALKNCRKQFETVKAAHTLWRRSSTLADDWTRDTIAEMERAAIAGYEIVDAALAAATKAGA